jgi:hypothetical protein
LIACAAVTDLEVWHLVRVSLQLRSGLGGASKAHTAW